MLCPSWLGQQTSEFLSTGSCVVGRSIRVERQLAALDQECCTKQSKGVRSMKGTPRPLRLPLPTLHAAGLITYWEGSRPSGGETRIALTPAAFASFTYS